MFCFCQTEKYLPSVWPAPLNTQPTVKARSPLDAACAIAGVQENTPNGSLACASAIAAGPKTHPMLAEFPDCAAVGAA